jgi:hypothetical protein
LSRTLLLLLVLFLVVLLAVVAEVDGFAVMDLAGGGEATSGGGPPVEEVSMASIAAASSTRTAPSAEAEAVPRLAVVDMMWTDMSGEWGSGGSEDWRQQVYWLMMSRGIRLSG